ncbi:MAG TPA: hypothetical protein ENH93_08695 [Pseudohongiella sp.]|nr:hypothetical protein [Pseudohongiella sp.]HEA63203.1 hypothetical protein [Pseudohongiella sp.]
MIKQSTLISMALVALTITGLIVLLSGGPVSAQSDGLNLITDTPDEGYALAVTLARRGVSTTQPNREVLFSLREEYAKDAGLLIASSRVIAIHFATIAEANDHWR